MSKIISIQSQQIKNYCQGNNNALCSFYKAEAGKLVFYAYSFVKDKEIAADVVSEVFERLLMFSVEERLKRFSIEEAHFKNTIYLIVRNKCLDYIKVEENRKRILDSKFQLNGSVEQNNAEVIFINDSFANLLSELGRQQQKILKLYLEGFNNSEIAEELEISYNTVRNTLSVSKRRVKDLWTDFFEG